MWCVFIFDRTILDALPRADRRVEFIRDSLVGLVVVVGVHRLDMQLGGQSRQGLRRMAVAHQHGHALDAVRGRERAQLRVQPDQAVADEFDAAIGTRQGVEDVAVEDEGAPDTPGRAQRVVQRRVVVGAQVTPQPDQGAVERLHGAAASSVSRQCSRTA